MITLFNVTVMMLSCVSNHSYFALQLMPNHGGVLSETGVHTFPWPNS